MIISLGSNYGHWPVAIDKLDSGSFIFSAGVGNDLTWEQEIAQRVPGIQIATFDPSPGVDSFAESIGVGRHYPVGISEHAKTLPFYRHVNHDFDTMSLVPGGAWETEPYFEAECWTIQAAMRALHVNRISYLKLCTGGDNEVSLVRSIMRDDIRPDQIGLLYMHFSPNDKKWSEKVLGHAGYTMACDDPSRGRCLYVRGRK